MMAAAIALALTAAPSAAESYTGTVTDSMCADGDHSGMRMGATDAECAEACADAHGADYVLSAGANVYVLSGEPQIRKFAGQKVVVTGTLDEKTKTIRVESIAAARP
jgi:hypothetical protein